MNTIDQACDLLSTKSYGDVESVGYHDVGIYISGICELDKYYCKNFIPDFPRDFKYDCNTCARYMRYNGTKA